MRLLIWLLTPLLVFGLQPPEKPEIYNRPFLFKGDTIDVYANAAFLYWKASQDNVSIGFETVAGEELTLHGGSVNTTFTGNRVPFNFNYEPGLQVGFGGTWKDDHIDVALQYTRFRSKSLSKFTGGGPVFLFASQVVAKVVETVGADFFKEGKGKWVLGLDFLDFSWGKLVYQSPSVLFHPFFALRNMWIRETFYLDYSVIDRGALRDDIKNRSHAWGIGPQIGFQFDWKICHPLFFFLKSSFDVLHTHYSILSQTTLSQGTDLTTLTSGQVSSVSSSFQQNNLSSLKSHFETLLGLNISTYFAKHQYRLEFSCGYDFQIFFGQNMFRHFSDDKSSAISHLPNGDLYIEGLNASLRFDY